MKSSLVLLILILIPLISGGLSLVMGKMSLKIPMFSSFLMLAGTGLYILLWLQTHDQLIYSTFNWITIQNHQINIGILIDEKSWPLLGVVIIISTLVHIYSWGYMDNPKDYKRFYSMLGLFTFAMLGVVVSSNLLITFCCWEWMGFSSYRLIGFWQEKKAAGKAALTAFLMNRVGDMGFIIGLMIIWFNTENFDIKDLMRISTDESWLTLASGCIFMGIIGKSAQFPLSGWLPGAMEGPTPVSALIHAATMVTAGVFLLYRIHFIFTGEVLFLVSIVGAVTSVSGAVSALVQFDLKKILAWSTVSQLGMMMMAMGAGAAHSSFFYLLNHAFFKAGLFLAAGVIIHQMPIVFKTETYQVFEQDIRKIGNIRTKMPWISSLSILLLAALAGLPFTTGFLSKESLLMDVTAWSHSDHYGKWIVQPALWLTLFLSPLYAFRLGLYLFTGPVSSIPIKSTSWKMVFPITLLALASISWIQLPFSFTGLIFNISVQENRPLLILSLLVLGISLASGYFLFRNKEPLSRPMPNIFFLDRIYRIIIITPIHLVSGWTNKLDTQWIDKPVHGLIYFQVTCSHLIQWGDKWIVDGLVKVPMSLLRGMGRSIRSLSAGSVQQYLLWTAAILLIYAIIILY